VAAFYANEQFPRQVVQFLRALGHDVLTVQEARNRGLADDEVITFASRTNRTVITLNRRHFIRLHKLQPDHAGVVVCSRDDQWERQANRIHAAISGIETLSGMLIRVNRPG
jgi:predicted nuclease of predicted toxin-antitoxin system